MKRHTPSLSPHMLKMIALIANARNCPKTIMNSLRVTREAAPLVRGDLREVDRHRHRGAADRRPQDEPEEGQHLVVGREDAPHRADEEDDRQHQDHPAPAQGV
jgi:hypothetical protein